jgi:hypothetical protein
LETSEGIKVFLHSRDKHFAELGDSDWLMGLDASQHFEK